MTGFSREVFALLHMEGPEDREGLSGGKSNPCRAAKLGLFLFFVGSRMGFKHLCLIFGIPSDKVLGFLG